MTNYLQRNYPTYKLDLDHELNLFDDLVSKIIVAKDKVSSCKSSKSKALIEKKAKERARQEQENLEELNEQLEEEKGNIKGDVINFKERLIGTCKLLESYKRTSKEMEAKFQENQMKLASILGDLSGKLGECESLEFIHDEANARHEKYLFQSINLQSEVDSLKKENQKWNSDIFTVKEEIDFLTTNFYKAKESHDSVCSNLKREIDFLNLARTKMQLRQIIY